MDGKWLPQTEDWGFMIPLIEMATHPMEIMEPLYFYEPMGDKDPQADAVREELIGKILSKKPCIFIEGIVEPNTELKP